MARLAAVVPLAATETPLYSPAATRKAHIKVFVNNQQPGNATVKIIHRLGAGPTVAADELARELIPSGANRRSEYFEVNNPEEILVESDIAGVVFQANGAERDI